jgi:hypothetical protein
MAELVLHYTTLDNLILRCLFFVNFCLVILRLRIAADGNTAALLSFNVRA